MTIISEYSKRPAKFIKVGKETHPLTGESVDRYVREPVKVPFGKKMVMAIVDHNGSKVTRHLLVDR